MLHGEALGLLIGAVALGALHGVEPRHGWPVAASYALDQTNKWIYGFAASLIIGVGHLISSIAMVVAFFYAKDYFNLAQANEPLTVFGTVQIGGPVSIVAGTLLIGLGVREYTRGHSHDHANEDHDHHGIVARLRDRLPLVSDHSHGDLDDAADRGLLGIAWFAFALGFAHEEEFEIIAICSGSAHCLELMTAYALTVIAGIVSLTLVLIGGYEYFEEQVEQYTPYLPAFSMVVLVGMGVGFITGLF